MKLGEGKARSYFNFFNKRLKMKRRKLQAKQENKNL